MSHALSSLQVAVAIAVVLAGCAPGSRDARSQVAPVATQPAEMPVSGTLATITEAVLVDAAGRSGLDRSDLVVESAEAVTWADGSLGCPEPGMMYTQALVPGYRIRVRAGDHLLDYHASERGYFVLCPPGRGVDPVTGTTI